MRPNTRQFCRLVAETFSLGEPIVEFGSYQYSGQATDADLRPLFPERRYVGCDVQPGPGVDRIEDVTQLGFADGSVPAVLCLETMEHVFALQRAFDEIHRVLQPGGLCLVTMPLNFRLHAFPDDYWRMTPSCLWRMLEPYQGRMVGFQGLPKFPHTVFGLAVKWPAPDDFMPCARAVEDGLRRWLDRQARSRPLADRFKSWLGRLRWTKGERARHRYQFHAEFRIECRLRAESKAA